MNELRKEIDRIDNEMQKLFIERMAVSQGVAIFKKTNDLPVLDEKRELEIIKKNIAKIDNDELKDLYEEFYKKMIEVSKKYQERIINR